VSRSVGEPELHRRLGLLDLEQKVRLLTGADFGPVGGALVQVRIRNCGALPGREVVQF